MASPSPDTVRGTSLLGLPDELLHHVLHFLEPLDLASAAQTCRRLASTSYDDQIWQPIITANTRRPVSKPASVKTFRDLYIAHHPYWYLTKHRIWFGDAEPSGKLIIARYDDTRGSIVAHSIVAQRGDHTLSFWEKDHEVIIHSFDPVVSLNMHQPVVQLDIGSARIQETPNNHPSDRNYAPESAYSKEILMDVFSESGLHSSFMLCRSLPDAAIGAKTAVWPPLRFPAPSRVRSDSSNHFNSAGHRPTRYAEVSQNNFRLRKWVAYHGRHSPTMFDFSAGNGSSAASAMGMPFMHYTTGFGGAGMKVRMPEDITTFASLPESCYMPTPHKPYQGLWCGDYSGHGCEFLIITQPDKHDERPLPAGMDWLRDWFRGGRRSSASSARSFVSAVEEQLEQGDADLNHHGGGDPPPPPPPSNAYPYESSRDYDDVPVGGRIEAIKLTGDPNIPRGEYTFVAPDIGTGGFVRVADEDMFLGARVVRSAGHIAGRGFQRDQYTPSQLIMISHDRLAQFWEGFGHISYYQRVDLDALTECGLETHR